MNDKMNDPYLNEYIIFDACKQYGVEFADVRDAAFAGRISYRSHLNSRGSEVYTFRRGDVIKFAEGLN